MENREPRTTSFVGSRFYPVSAVVCLFSTSSGWISTLCSRIPGPAPLERGMELLVGAIFIAALIFSTIAAFSLIISGEHEIGTVTIRGRRIPKPALWTGYLLAYLVPWLGVLAAVTRI